MRGGAGLLVLPASSALVPGKPGSGSRDGWRRCWDTP